MHFLPSNFGGLPEPYSDLSRAAFIILPVPYQGTVSYKGGTKDGPMAIIAASQQVELFDEEIGLEPYRAGIATLGALEVTATGPQPMVRRVYQTVKSLIGTRFGPGSPPKRRLVILGGEHSIAIGAVKAAREQHRGLSVLQLDAHADLRNRFESSPYNHACTMRRIREICPALQVGVRNLSLEEYRYVKKKRIKIFFAKDIQNNYDWLDEALDLLSDTIYITIDLDVFDPSQMPAVGTPEPGGLFWYQIVEILRRTVEAKNIVGFDVVELAPIPGVIAPDFLAAKLVYKLIGFLVAKDQIAAIGGERR